jgi:hypothetical protein
MEWWLLTKSKNHHTVLITWSPFSGSWRFRGKLEIFWHWSDIEHTNLCEMLVWQVQDSVCYCIAYYTWSLIFKKVLACPVCQILMVWAWDIKENIWRQSCSFSSSLQIHNKKCFDFSIHSSYGLHSLANYVTRLEFGTVGDVSCVILLLTLDSCLFALSLVFLGPHISCHAKLNYLVWNTLDNNIQQELETFRKSWYFTT